MWIEQSLHEINDLDSCCAGTDTFMAAVESYEKEKGRSAPAQAFAFHEFIDRYGPEGMRFSLPLVTMLMTTADRPGITQMHAWSLVLETERFGRIVTLRDFRHTWGPNGIPTNEALSEVWKAQKVARDPVTRSDNWLDRAEAWSLQGLARKTADA